jgi:hypothetical protein
VDIFIDESGDLGTNIERSSKYFVLAALISREKAPIQRCFKKIRNTLKKSKTEIPEFKFTQSNQTVKRRVFHCLSSNDFSIAYSYFSKEEIHPHLNGNSNIYVDLTTFLISQILEHANNGETINLVIDRSLNGTQQSKFNSELTSKVMENPGIEIYDPERISIAHVDSKSDVCIQAVDFIAGAIYSKYHSNESEYYNQIKDKMILELNYLNTFQNKKM